MVDLLAARTACRRSTPTCCAACCADLRISEIVDMPNWVVSLYFPRLVLQ